MTYKKTMLLNGDIAHDTDAITECDISKELAFLETLVLTECVKPVRNDDGDMVTLPLKAFTAWQQYSKYAEIIDEQTILFDKHLALAGAKPRFVYVQLFADCFVRLFPTFPPAVLP